MEVQVQGDGLVVTTDRRRADWTVESWLTEGLSLPAGFVRQLFREHRVLLGAAEAEPAMKPGAGRRLRLVGGVDEPFGVIPAPSPSIPPAVALFEDDHILVVDKPAGLLVYPGTPDDADTLAQRVAVYWERQGLRRKIRHVHRLDKDTTGAVLYAKHAYVARALDRQLAVHQIERIYVALVEGHIDPPEGVIDAPIGRDRHVAGRYRVSPTGRLARTHYRTIAVRPAREGWWSLLMCRLETGRTHQIRVHLSHLGAPIVGDALYGATAAWPHGHALHAWRVQFTHPYTGEPMTVSAPLPEPWVEEIGRPEWQLLGGAEEVLP
jgi:23S rRNA pseudouridine1911/1915/1917 synthase